MLIFIRKKQTKTDQLGKNITKKTTTEFKKDSGARLGRWILLSRELGPPTFFRDSTIIFFNFFFFLNHDRGQLSASLS